MRAVTESDLQNALRPWLGTDLTANTALCGHLTAAFTSWNPYRDSFDALKERLEHSLFRELYGILGERMTIPLPGGHTLRIRMSDMPALADAALGAQFACFPAERRYAEQLKKYAMETGSISAMRCLVTRYAAELSAQEIALMTRIADENTPNLP